MVFKFLSEPQGARGLFIVEHWQDKVSDYLSCKFRVDVIDCDLVFGAGSTNPDVGLACSSF